MGMNFWQRSSFLAVLRSAEQGIARAYLYLFWMVPYLFFSWLYLFWIDVLSFFLPAGLSIQHINLFSEILTWTSRIILRRNTTYQHQVGFSQHLDASKWIFTNNYVYYVQAVQGLREKLSFHPDLSLAVIITILLFSLWCFVLDETQW